MATRNFLSLFYRGVARLSETWRRYDATPAINIPVISV